MKPLSQAAIQVDAESDAVSQSVRGAVDNPSPSGWAVYGAVREAVGEAVYVAVNVAVPMGGAVYLTVNGAVTK
jgi:hypothetical protein